MQSPPKADFPVKRAGDRLKLLKFLAAELDHQDLSTIAHQDWGRDVDEHLAQLHLIANRLIIPSPLKWCPAEVLELTRWNEESAENGGEAVIRLHRQRAFSCCVLMVAMGDPANETYGSNDTLIQLIESIEKLRYPAEREAADLLEWLIPVFCEAGVEEVAFAGLGLLYFALAIPVRDNAELVALIDWIMAKEDEISGRWREDFGAGATGAWLLSTTTYNQRHAKWQQLGPKLVDRLTDDHGEQVATGVKLIALMLAEGDVRTR